MKENIRQFVRDSLPKFFQRALHVNLTAGDIIQESNRILNGTKVLNLGVYKPLTNKRRNLAANEADLLLLRRGAEKQLTRRRLWARIPGGSESDAHGLQNCRPGPEHDCRSILPPGVLSWME